MAGGSKQGRHDMRYGGALPENTTPPLSPNSSDDHQKILASIHAYLTSKPNVWKVLLFGSFLRNPATARGIDIGFESREMQDPSKIVEWADELKVLIGKEVDLVDLSSSYQNDMLAIRRGGQYISPAGTLFQDRIFVKNVELLGKYVFAMQKLWEELNLHLQNPNYDTYGIAKRFEKFYQQWENFAETWLKICSLPIPSAKSYHIALVTLFTTPGNQVTPLMDEGAAVIINDLRRFTHFSRKAYIQTEEIDLTIMKNKVDQLPSVINWAKTAVLSYSV